MSDNNGAVTTFRLPLGLTAAGKTNGASAQMRATLEQQVKGLQKQREALAVEIGERVDRLQDIDMTIAGAADMMAKIDRDAFMRNLPPTHDEH